MISLVHFKRHLLSQNIEMNLLIYVLEQFQSPNPVNVKTLAEKLLSRIDPTNVLEQCEKLENKILTFNDRISTDEYYKKSKVIPFLCIGSGATVAIASLIGLIFAPVVLEIETILVATGSTMTKSYHSINYSNF